MPRRLARRTLVALASWSCLLAVSGFACDGPAGRLAFAPRLFADDFRCFFSAAEGWGSFAQRRDAKGQSNVLELRWGRLTLREVRTELPAGAALGLAGATVAGQRIAAVVERSGQAATIRFDPPLELLAGQRLAVDLT